MKVIKGKYKSYTTLADGTLKYNGVVEYSYIDKSAESETDTLDAQEIKIIDEARRAQHEAECVAFENLVDAACEWEG